MAANNGLELWVYDVHKDVSSLGLKIVKTLFSGKSRFQQVDVVESKGLGRVLLNDGLFMLSEADEFIYHEMIAHVPLFVHPCPERVLIIGGGDGGTAREVLKHPQIRRVVMVEIDEMVVNASREYLPSLSCAFDDPRLEIRIEDGIRYMAETKEHFDIILVDSTDPVGPAAPLFDAEFYRNAARVLSSEGILISQAESPFYDQDIQRSMFANQRLFFKKLHLYLFANMTYPGGLWGFGFASKELCPIRNFDAERVRSSEIKFRYYNENIHSAAFILPTFLFESLKDILDSDNALPES